MRRALTKCLLISRCDLAKQADLDVLMIKLAIRIFSCLITVHLNEACLMGKFGRRVVS